MDEWMMPKGCSYEVILLDKFNQRIYFEITRLQDSYQIIILFVNGMKEEIDLLKQYIKALESQNASKNTERSTLQTQLTTLIEDNSKLRDKISSLPTLKQLQAYKKEVKQLRQINKQKTLEQLQQNKENCTSNINKLKTTIHQKDNQISRMNQQICRLRQIEQKQLQDTNKLKQQIEKNKEEITGFKQRLQFKNGIIAQLERQKNSLKDQLDDIKANCHIEIGKVTGLYEAEMHKMKEDNHKMMRSSNLRKQCCLELSRTKQQLNNNIMRNSVLENQLAELRQQLSLQRQQTSKYGFKPFNPQVMANQNFNRVDKWSSLQHMIDVIRSQNQDLMNSVQY